MSETLEGRAPIVAVVDDEEDIATYLRRALEDNGYEVLTTSDSTAAMDLLRTAMPDAICLDVLMPKHTGISLYSEIMRHPALSRCPVILMSGMTMRGDLSEMLGRAGGLPAPAAFIEKPIDIEALLTTLQKVLGRQSGASS